MICPLEDCDGQVAREQQDDFVVYRCGTCETEWAQHVRTADPKVQRSSYLEQAGIPPIFRGRPFEQTSDNESALFICRGWVADFPKDRLSAPALCGEQGRGKTHLLSAICVRLIREKGQRVWFRSVRQMMREFQDFDGGGEAAWNRAVSVDVLALDDVGAEQDTEWRADQLADLIDERYQNELTILVASNFEQSTWGQVLDDRTASRLAQMTFQVKLKGPDRRQTSLEG